MASWINDNRAAILNKNRVEYKGLAGIRQKALLKKIMRDLQGTDGEPLPNKTQKVKHTLYILHCLSLSHNGNNRPLRITTGRKMILHTM